MNTNLPVFFIVPPFSCVDRTTSVVKDSFSVTLTFKELPTVLVALGILGSINALQKPGVCAQTMLEDEEPRLQSSS